jgi:hypothetical protein
MKYLYSKCVGIVSLALVGLTIFSTSCDGEESADDPGTRCCDCLIQQGGWDHNLCPVEAHCYCLYAADPPPSCEPDDNCFAADWTAHCEEECAELADEYW